MRSPLPEASASPSFSRRPGRRSTRSPEGARGTAQGSPGWRPRHLEDRRPRHRLGTVVREEHGHQAEGVPDRGSGSAPCAARRHPGDPPDPNDGSADRRSQVDDQVRRSSDRVARPRPRVGDRGPERSAGEGRSAGSLTWFPDATRRVPEDVSPAAGHSDGLRPSGGTACCLRRPPGSFGLLRIALDPVAPPRLSAEPTPPPPSAVVTEEPAAPCLSRRQSQLRLQSRRHPARRRHRRRARRLRRHPARRLRPRRLRRHPRHPARHHRPRRHRARRHLRPRRRRPRRRLHPRRPRHRQPGARAQAREPSPSHRPRRPRAD